jgi:signal transduction histidine kinase
MKVGGESFLVQRRRIQVAGGLDWELLAAIPEGDLLEEPRKLALVALVLSLGALGVLAWRMAWSSRLIVAPLERLASQAECLVDGHAITSPDTPIIELQNLARTLRVASIAIGERDHLESHLRLAQRREMIGTLAAGVAHDLGNLLFAVGANLEIAQDPGFPEAARTHALDQAATALRRGRGFLRALLTIGRPVSEEPPSPIELGNLVQESASLLEPLLGARITLKVDLPSEPLWIQGDHLQLEQVLLNLALNARDAMPGGGPLTLEAGRGADGRPFLAVADAGVGIAPEVRDQVFMPFFTTKGPNHGSGLGLAMVQGIARAHGTEVELESKLGRGSRFILRFPGASSAATEG